MMGALLKAELSCSTLSKIDTSIKLYSVITKRSFKTIHTELTLIFYQHKKFGIIVMFNHVNIMFEKKICVK